MPIAAETHHGYRTQHTLPLDDAGFLIDPQLWNRDIATQLAARLGVDELGPTHWLIIDFMRARFQQFGALPPMRSVCHKLGVDRSAVKQSFGSCRYAWQIAGLPHPGDEVISYM